MRKLLLSVSVGLVAYLLPGGLALAVRAGRSSCSLLQQIAVFVYSLAVWDGFEGPHARLLGAARNATTDQESLALLVGQFLRQKGPELEEEFVAFLQREAATSRVGLERGLDALLAVYRFLAPFLVTYALVRLVRGPSSRDGHSSPETASTAADPSLRQPSLADGEHKDAEGEAATHSERLPVEALRRLFREIDTNQDGQISKRELLLALRRDSSLAALLGLPAKVSQSRADGSYEAFEAAFALIDQDSDDAVSWGEFCDLFRRRQREAAAEAAGRGQGSLAACGAEAPGGAAGAAQARTAGAGEPHSRGFSSNQPPPARGVVVSSSATAAAGAGMKRSGAGAVLGRMAGSSSRPEE